MIRYRDYAKTQRNKSNSFIPPHTVNIQLMNKIRADECRTKVKQWSHGFSSFSHSIADLKFKSISVCVNHGCLKANDTKEICIYNAISMIIVARRRVIIVSVVQDHLGTYTCGATSSLLKVFVNALFEEVETMEQSSHAVSSGIHKPHTKIPFILNQGFRMVVFVVFFVEFDSIIIPSFFFCGHNSYR